ncbi:MAG: DUF3592 domain-containing protein [Desulfobacter sp.]|nr:MAG: DUF3592 domain-containing protein [Desulfobacter sp.]
MVRDKWIEIVISIIFLIGGILLVTVGMSQGWKGILALTWDKHPGKITYAHINNFRPAGERSKSGYRVEFHFSYRVNRYSFNGKLLYPGYDYNGSREGAEKWLNKFPKKKAVEVYVNPEKPQEAMLAPGLHLEYIGRPLSGIAMVILSLFLLSRRFRKN